MRALLFALLGLLVGGCQTAGPDFSSAPLAGMRLGETTEEEVRAWFGEPSDRVQQRPGRGREVLYFRRATGSVEGAESRVLAVELVEDLVEAWLLDSTLEEDATDFSAERRRELVVGESTAADVLERVGPPSGRARPGSVLAAQHLGGAPAAGAAEVWLWRHTDIDRTLVFLRSRTEVLAVVLDARGRVLQVAYDDDF